MRNVDIMEALVSAIEETIREKWRHDVIMEGWSSDHINVDIDEKEYVITLHEVRDGEHFSDYLGGRNNGE